MRTFYTFLLTLVIATAIITPAAAQVPPPFMFAWGSNGTGPGQFIFGDGACIDPSGDVLVTDLFGRVQKFTPSGQYLTGWGANGSAPGEFSSPVGIAADNQGFIYVCDQGNHRIQKFTNAGVYVTQWGTNGSGPGQFQYPFDVAWNPVNNRLYVTDQLNSRACVYDTDGNLLFTFGQGLLVQGYEIAFDSAGNVYIVVSNASNISFVATFTAGGVYLGQWGSGGTGDGQFNHPIGIAIDALDRVYIGDKDSNRIQCFTAAGTFLMKWGSAGTGNGQFNLVYGLACNAAGDVYACDHYNHRIQVFGSGPTPTIRSSWGRLKELYR